MKQEMIIGVSVIVAVIVVVGVHGWLHRLVKFKMDESAILKFFEEADGDCKSHSTDVISSAAGISIERVIIVCSKSKAIKRSPEEDQSWCLK